MQWIRSQRPGENGINIITADFVELGEFISAVISLNYHLDDDEDDATWGVAGWGGARPPPGEGQCFNVCSHSSLWHLFQEEGCTASFTLFRAIMTGELKRLKGWWGKRRSDFGVAPEHKDNDVLCVCVLFGDIKWGIHFISLPCCKNTCFHPPSIKSTVVS